MTFILRRAALVVIISLAGCGDRGVDRSIVPGAAPGVIERVFVATTRKPDDTDPTRFTGDRSEVERYLRYDVAIPPDRKDGTITWPPERRKPDPEKDFLTAGKLLYPDTAAFRRDLGAALRLRPAGKREAVVFVHGFNTNFVEGVYRIAQLGHDLGTGDPLVHYSWPSRGNPLGYVYDRDSVLFARDGLESLLKNVIDAGADRILIVGHSLGAALTMETLRQIALSGDRKVSSRLAGVVLIAPDLDVDVFKTQARGIGKLPQPFMIFTNRKDKALALSGRLTGAGARLGNVTDVSEIDNLPVTLVDTTAFSVGTGHFNVGNSPTLISILGRVGQIDQVLNSDARRSGLLPGIVLTLQNATEIILTPVVTIASASGK